MKHLLYLTSNLVDETTMRKSFLHGEMIIGSSIVTNKKQIINT